MPKRLENLTGRPVLFMLAGGDPIRLSPGATSATLDDVEVVGHQKVEELVARGVIAVHDHAERSDEPPPEGGQGGEPRAEAEHVDDDRADDAERPRARRSTRSGRVP
jgi:hypothetical protein